MAGYSVDGLVSGLSTSALIDQLMQAEAGTQTKLKTRVTARNRQIEAYQAVNAKLSALVKSAAALVGGSGLAQAKATSSAASVVATARPGALPGALSFSVDRLARAEVHLSDPVASTDALVTDGSPVTVNGRTVTVADGRLSTVVSAINTRSDLGVRAAAVKVDDGSYRLQLTATTSGDASSFTTGGLLVREALPGQDAGITVAGVAGYTVASPTNTFTDVLPGVTFTVTKEGETATVDVAHDRQASADLVKGLVDAANAVLVDIDRYTAYDAKTKTGAALTGDSLMRNLEQRLLSTIGVTGGAGSLGDVGVQITREGRFSFDAEKFKTAVAADPAKAARLLDAATAVTGSLRSAASTRTTAAGDYAVVVTAAATRASGSLALPASVTGGEVFSATTADGRTVSYTATAGDGGAEVAAGLRAAASAQGVAVTVEVDPADAGRVQVTTVEYGAGATLALAAAGLTSTATGTDVAGTIDGAVATGRGTTLEVTDGDARGFGLSVVTDPAGTGPVGTVTVTDGFAKGMAFLADVMSRSDGSIATAVESRRSDIKTLDGQIASWDQRLELRRKGLQRQFSGLEVALGNLRNQSNWLAGQIAALPRYQ